MRSVSAGCTGDFNQPIMADRPQQCTRRSVRRAEPWPPFFVAFCLRLATIRPMEPPNPTFDPAKITRPDPSLPTYYLLVSLLAGPAFPIAFLPLVFKYQTLRYHFDDEGI